MKILLLILFIAVSGTGYSQSMKPLSLNKPSNSDYLKQLNDQVFISYTYIRNLGNFGDTYKYGSGIYLNYGKYFPDSWLAVGRIGFLSHELRSGVDSGGYTDFKVYPVHIGGRYYVYKNLVMPYFSFMNGLNFISSSNFLGNTGVDDQSIIRYAFQVGFGTDIKIGRNFGINLNINYNNSFYSSSDSELQIPSYMMTGFEYSAGLTYGFGK